MRTLGVLALAAALPLAASAAEDVQVQEATGQAAVLSGDKPAAREKAIDDALRQAVKMAAGTQVQSVTEVQEFQTKMDTVLEHSTGYVKRYEILKEGMDGEVVQVTVRAQVSLLALDKDLEALGLLMARKNFPRTMVLIAEQKAASVGGFTTTLTAAQAQQIRGIRSVAQRSYSGGTQELDVTLVGSTEQFAEELESKKLGRFTVRVTSVTANTVDVELGQ